MLFPQEIKVPENYFGYIYITHDQKTNLKYVGHSTKRVEIEYFGSGTNIRKVIKERGTYFLKRIILGFCNSEEELIDCETECKLFFNVLDPLYGYNLILEDYNYARSISYLFNNLITAKQLYLFKEILDLKDLNFNDKLILSCIFEFNLLSKNNCYQEVKNFCLIIDKSWQTLLLIFKKLLKLQYIIADKDNHYILITDKIKKLFINFNEIKKLNRYSIEVSNDILFNSNLNSIEKIVLSILKNYTKFQDICFISNKKLAKILNVSSIYISKIISSLIKKNVIEATYTYKDRKIDRRFITILPIKDKEESKKAFISLQGNRRIFEDQFN